MKIAISNDKKENKVIDFLINYSSFTFITLKEIYKTKEDKVIIFKGEITEKLYLSIIDNLKTYNNTTTILFIPIKLNNTKINKKVEKVVYPIPLKLFDEKIKNFINSKLFSFNHLTIVNDNFLINNINNQKIFLTEIELKILKFLFKKITVEKNQLKTQILKLQNDIETKSLESHFSRIRKKISKINGNIEIIPLSSHKVTIRHI